MKKIKNWVIKHILILVFLVLFMAPFAAVGVMQLCKTYFPTWFDASQWGSLLSGLWAYIGTAFLGFLALWQNIRQKESNDASEEKLREIIEQMLKLEHQKAVPTVTFSFRGYSSFPGEGMTVDLEISNIGQTSISNMRVKTGKVILDKNEEKVQILPQYIGALKDGETKKVTLRACGLGCFDRNGGMVELVITFMDIFEVDYAKKVLLLITPELQQFGVSIGDYMG